jgi:hypothetical protein
MKLCGIYFGEPRDHVVRRAATYDVVLVVGEEYVLVDRIDAYATLGVEAKLYPLPAVEAPTIVSLLGVLGWLLERLEHGRRVLVEGTGGHSVLAAACLIMQGLGLDEALAKVKEAGMELYSPLQLRVLAILEAISQGVDVASEAKRFKQYAFTGGDAHTASVIELAIDHAIQLSPMLPVSPVKLYQRIVDPARAPRLNSVEETILEVARALDSTLVGAVRSIYLEPGSSKLRVTVGCSLLMREDECWPEATAADTAYRKLASFFGLTGVEYEMVEPEEAACLAYGLKEPSMCRGATP